LSRSMLLDKDADANEKGRTALIWAATKGHVKVASLLLEKGADLIASARSFVFFWDFVAVRCS
jgi:ankyrin repeat protein